jgi:DNA-binding XRE family transcriptional regulator
MFSYTSSVWSNADGYVYAVHDVDRDLIKIGCAMDPTKRLAVVASECRMRGSRSPLAVLGVMKVRRCYDVEQSLHRHFNKHRVYREWFKLHPIDIMAIFNPDGINAVLRAEKGRRLADDRQKKQDALRQRERIKAQGELVLQIRKAKRWSRARLASHAGISYETLMDIEKGSLAWGMRQKTAARLAQALGVRVSMLIGEDTWPCRHSGAKADE